MGHDLAIDLAQWSSQVSLSDSPLPTTQHVGMLLDKFTYSILPASKYTMKDLGN